MGYASTIPFGFIQLGCEAEAAIAATPVAANTNINNIVLPTWNYPVSYAYLDLACHSVQDISGFPNWLTAGSWGIVDTSATYHSAGSIPNWLFRVAANAWEYGGFYAYGSNNIAPYLTSGATQMIRFNAMTSEEDSMTMFGVYGVLRLYFFG